MKREDLRHGTARRLASARERLRSLRGWTVQRAWPAVRERGRAAWARARPAVARAVRAGWTGVAAAWARTVPAVERAVAELRRRRLSRQQTIVLLSILLAAGWILWQRCGVSGCPDVGRLGSYQPGGASVLFDRTGERFADLAPMEYEVVSLDSLPEYVPQAFLAVEDKRFFEHRGVDWLRVLGAVWADIRAGGLVEGSSTIPMQLSRTLFPDRIPREEKTFRRKLLEARVAGVIEARFTKEEILELYLNHVYLGGGSYGIQAASRYYFGKDATELELEEAAMLAALPKAPAHYDPRRRAEAARARRDLVLTLMERQDRLSYQEAQAARERPLDPVAESQRDPDGDLLAPYFVQHVRRLLEEELGEDLYSRPLRILTTLDPTAQRAAEAELEAQLQAVERGAYGRLRGPEYRRANPGDDGPGYLQGAVVVMDVRSGDVRAWVGGRDYDHSRYDRARLGRRQTGSAFKPFVYAAAVEAGFPPSQPILDSPYRLARAGSQVWEPRNYSGRFEGRMSMREALMRSQNVPAVRLAAAVGDDRVRSFAQRAGLSADVPDSPVAALGVTDASPLEMTLAYASFAGGGERPEEPRFVLRVEDEAGNVLLRAAEPERTRATDPVTAYLVTHMLRSVVDYGTAAGVRRVGFRGAAAGKTGTTSDATDVWFIGYTPELVGTVWVGFDEVRPLPARATGGGIAALAWGRMMARVYEERPAPDWPEPPEGIVALTVDPETGMPLGQGCRPRYSEARWELFRAGEEPWSICPSSGGRGFIDRLARLLGRPLYREDYPAPRIPGTPDPNLGVPRLPTGRGAEAASARVAPDRDGVTARGGDERWRGGERRRRERN